MTKKVIIIDDSVTSLNLLKGKFASEGWEVYGTSSAKDGYDMIFDIAPDLIITDAIMPVVGGFRFVKMTRENEKTAKIPIIVYSVLPENNAKFYLKQDCIEYFLSKNENIDELVVLANKLTKEYPLSEDYKFEILKSKFISLNVHSEIKIPPKMEEDDKIDFNKLEQKFKEKYNFNFSDEKIFSDFFKILYPILEYELCIVFPQQNHKSVKSIYFDIRDIILSPIFQNKIMEKYGAKDTVLFKKYAPNLKMFANEDEFPSKIEFHFDYRDKPLADMVFYSKEKSKWENEENIETVKRAVYDFFKAYFVNKNSTSAKKDNFGEKYFGQNFNILNKQELINRDKNIFIGILSISNYSDAISGLAGEDVDILNSKISEKIIGCLEPDEQVIKNDEDEYSIVIHVKEQKNALDRFNYIVNTIEHIPLETHKLEAIIGASDCIIEGNYNIFEAQKRAYEALDKTTTTEKTVIYNAAK